MTSVEFKNLRRRGATITMSMEEFQKIFSVGDGRIMLGVSITDTDFTTGNKYPEPVVLILYTKPGMEETPDGVIYPQGSVEDLFCNF